MTTTKIISTFALAAFFAVGAAAISNVHAQAMAVMPVLYNASSQAVNTTSGVSLAAGNYYLQPGASSVNEVYYNGAGVFSYYNTSNGSYYGGSVYNPNGTAGVSLNYVANPTSPSVPNTGVGGDSAVLWFTIVLSGLVTASGLAYLARARHGLVLKNQ